MEGRKRVWLARVYQVAYVRNVGGGTQHGRAVHGMAPRASFGMVKRSRAEPTEHWQPSNIIFFYKYRTVYSPHGIGA